MFEKLFAGILGQILARMNTVPFADAGDVLAYANSLREPGAPQLTLSDLRAIESAKTAYALGRVLHHINSTPTGGAK